MSRVVPSARNALELRLFGMKRSGHHAVMHWIASQLPGAVLHLNNIEFVRESGFGETAECQRSAADYEFGCKEPFARARLGARSASFYRGGHSVGRVKFFHPDLTFSSAGDRLTACALAERAACEAAALPEQRDCLVLSFEDFPLHRAAEVPWELASRGESERCVYLLVVRDPFNWVASRMRAGLRTTDATLGAYRSHLFEFAQPGGHLSPCVAVSYNAWFSDAAYRRGIAAELGLSLSDAGLDDIPGFGNGSSFDGERFSGRARQMDVLDRWQHYRHDPGFFELFARNPDLIELSERVFSFNPL